MIKRFLAFLLVLLALVPRAYALSAADISAECAVVMTAQTGEVIFGKNEHKKHSMASTTKIMTSLIAAESGRLQNEIKVTSDMLKVEGTSMGLVSGDSVSLRELVYGMLLPSGNDAANVTALYLGGSQEKFAALMNRRAKEIGMKNSSFVTPSGLDDENHYSTAYDMALLGREAVKNPEFLKICSSGKAKLSYGNPPYDRYLFNHNRLLTSYEGALGIKTGFTKKSGRCLVSYAERDGVGLVAVTLNDGNDWYDHRRMLDYGFSCVKAEKINLNAPKNVSVAGGKSDTAPIKVGDCLVENTGSRIAVRLFIPKFLYAPVKSGTVIGKADIYSDEKYLESIPVTVTQDVEMSEHKAEEKKALSFSERIKEFFHD